MGYLTQANIGGSDYTLANGLYGTCGTAAGTAAKVVTCPEFDNLTDATGVTIHVKFTYSNTASNATLKVGNAAAAPLCMYGTTRVGTTEKTSWKAGAVVSFTYDGTSWVMNDYIPDTGITTDTQNTAGSNLDSGQLFLIGAKTQTTGSNGVQTYSNPGLYATAGSLVCLSISTDGDTFYELDTACCYDTTSEILPGTNSTKLPTAKAVADYVASQAAGAATFQGTLVQTDTGSSSTKWTQAELEAASYKKGWYWVCEAAGTYAGNVMEVGDMLFCVSDKSSAYATTDFTAIQNNIETLTNGEIDTLWAAA